MALVDINWHSSDRQLRQFGGAACLALPLVGWWWSDGSIVAVTVLALVGVVVGSMGLLRPQWLKPAFLMLTILAVPIGLVVGELVLLAIYFAVVLPIGLATRSIRRSNVQLRFDADAKTYWEPKKVPQDAASYYRQF